MTANRQISGPTPAPFSRASNLSQVALPVFHQQHYRRVGRDLSRRRKSQLEQVQ